MTPSDVFSYGNSVETLPLTQPAQSPGEFVSIDNSRSSSDGWEIHSPFIPAFLNGSEASIPNDGNLLIDQDQNFEPTLAVKIQIWVNKYIRSIMRDYLTHILKLFKEGSYNFPIPAANLVFSN